MAYETGVATSREDLISKLCTFAVASGWTNDEFSSVNYRATLHKGNCYVHFWWNDTEATLAKSIAMYQSLGWTSGNLPYNHPNDAGGDTTTTQGYRRKAIKYIGNGPFVAYHFFSHTDVNNIYCVLEYAAGIFRHFGFGNIVKFGTWTGGEWVAGHSWGPSNKATPTHGDHSVLMDGVHLATLNEAPKSGGTIHLEGFTNQVASSKWGHCGTNTNVTNSGTDRAGIGRNSVLGGFRRGPHLTLFNWLRCDALSGLVNLVPIPLWYVEPYTTSPYLFRLMGFMHNVYHLQMAAWSDGDEITIGANTYKIFSAVRKRYVQDTNEESWNAGIAYRKVV